jgi:heme a synthase
MLMLAHRLSITEWRPVTGSLPPMNQADWEAEFEKYKSSPEFAMLNSRMTLEDFKSIYWMEWVHRLWGRVIGVSFVLPAIYFTARRQMSMSMTAKVWGIAGLIGFQGFLGWWMVKSGLTDDLFAPGSTPRVSQYRLTAHLGAAFVVYLSMLYTGLTTLRDNKILKSSPDSALSSFKSFALPQLRSFRITTYALLALTFTTAMSGALVAGLDAGLIYNEFPWMGMGLTPPKSELFSSFYSHVPANESGKHSDLIWRNMFENSSLVQLDHRILATTTFTTICGIFAWTRFSKSLKSTLPRPAMKAMHGVLGFACLQVVLGISTLLYLVPVPLASAHQAGALALLTWTTVLASRVHMSPSSLRTIAAQAGHKGRLGYQTPLSPPINRASLDARAQDTIEHRFGVAEAIKIARLEKMNPAVAGFVAKYDLPGDEKAAQNRRKMLFKEESLKARSLNGKEREKAEKKAQIEKREQRKAMKAAKALEMEQLSRQADE